MCWRGRGGADGGEGAEGSPCGGQPRDGATWQVAKGNKKAAKQPALNGTEAGAGTSGRDALVVFLRTNAGRKNINKVRPDLVNKELQAAVGKTVERVQSGAEHLKIFCASAEQKTKLLQLQTLCDLPIEVTEPVRGYRLETASQAAAPHSHIRGVIKGVLLEITDQEIREELGVRKAMRIQKYINGRLVNTSTIQLIFKDDITERPAHVRLFGQRIRVFEFNPTPMRCYSCQLFGHTSRVCRATSKICPKCAGKHDVDACTAEERKCANCGGPHAAGYHGCLAFKEAKAVTSLASA